MSDYIKDLTCFYDPMPISCFSAKEEDILRFPYQHKHETDLIISVFIYVV